MHCSRSAVEVHVSTVSHICMHAFCIGPTAQRVKAHPSHLFNFSPSHLFHEYRVFNAASTANDCQVQANFILLYLSTATIILAWVYCLLLYSNHYFSMRSHKPINTRMAQLHTSYSCKHLILLEDVSFPAELTSHLHTSRPVRLFSLLLGPPDRLLIGGNATGRLNEMRRAEKMDRLSGQVHSKGPHLYAALRFQDGFHLCLSQQRNCPFHPLLQCSCLTWAVPDRMSHRMHAGNKHTSPCSR